MFHGLKLVRPRANAGKNLPFIVQIKSLRESSAETFGRIYQRFRHPILSYVRARVQDQEVAEEITQDIFMKVFRFRAGYQERFAFSTWLWTIAKNTVSDHLRGRRDRSDQFDTEIQAEEIPCTGSNAESRILEKDERRKIFKKLRSLTRLQKRVLWMRLIHQLSYEEISKRLGLSLAAVKNLIYRSRQVMLHERGKQDPALIP